MVMGEPLDISSAVGHYRIVSRIGSGGMGEVYLAQDTRLDRMVAIKFLNEECSSDDDKLKRFIQEAKAASALNHPNILTIHEIGETNGTNYIVSEMIDGKTLRECLSENEPLTIDFVLSIGIQVAEALSAAHEAGIIHRDVKPENIMIRKDGYAKVLDFGLAKLSERLGFSSGEGASEDQTRLQINTRPGIVMGTASYMSPEQVRGKDIDVRTDVFSLGVVLYEMLSGEQPFVGETPADVMGSILLKDPVSISQLVPQIPPELEHIVNKALKKTRDDRYQAIRALLSDLKEARRELEFRNKLARASSLYHARGETQVMSATSLESVASPPLPRLSQITFTESIEQYPAWSPDSEEFVFSREVDGIRSLFSRNIVSGDERRLTEGNYDDIQPVWSPDGKTILFVRSRQPHTRLEPGDVFGLFLDGDIWSLDLATNKETKLIENAFNPDISPDGKRVAFDASWAGPRRIWAVDTLGHNPQQLTSDTSEGISHVRPRWSPDGRQIVFQNIERTKFDVRVFDPAEGKLIWVTNDAVQDLNPIWSPSGRYIYFSSYRGGGINIWRSAMSPDGNPASAPQQLTIGAGQDVEVAMSRDGKRLAFSILRQNADIWRLPLSPETGQPTGAPEEVITTTREDSRGAWSPDGKTIAFNSDRTGEMNIWLYSLETRRSRQLTKGGGGDFQANWSPDGKSIAFFSSRSGTADIWCVDVESGELERLTSTDSVDVNPFFSPDGSMIAFNSDRTGRPEVWVMKSDGSEARQLAEANLGVMGHFMRWNQSGDAVIFRCPASGGAKTVMVRLDGADAGPFPEVAGGAHMSLSPDNLQIIDVVGHKTLWVSPLNGGSPERVFEFDDPDVRIDYPVWSPDGRWILFDRFRPKGGDVWMMENFE